MSLMIPTKQREILPSVELELVEFVLFRERETLVNPRKPAYIPS